MTAQSQGLQAGASTRSHGGLRFPSLHQEAGDPSEQRARRDSRNAKKGFLPNHHRPSRRAHVAAHLRSPFPGSLRHARGFHDGRRIERQGEFVDRQLAPRGSNKESSGFTTLASNALASVRDLLQSIDPGSTRDMYGAAMPEIRSPGTLEAGMEGLNEGAPAIARISPVFGLMTITEPTHRVVVINGGPNFFRRRGLKNAIYCRNDIVAVFGRMG